jgi:hypothetical protein
MGVKGYKGFSKDLQCRGMRYEIGGTYEMTASPSVCNCGFHFCENMVDVHDYYKLGVNRVCEIEALGEIAKEGNKSATNKIKIIRELSREEIRLLGNSGNENTGYRNSGNRNSGYRNSGNRNSGDWNSGYRNSGNMNSGDWNSGDCNSCNRSAGMFMSKRISWEAFNKTLTQEEFEEITSSLGYQICQRFELVKFRIQAKTGKFGDFRYLSYKSSWKYLWSKLTFEERMAVRNMPHFDKDVFFEITGIKV